MTKKFEVEREVGARLHRWVDRFAFRRGVAIDQTARGALAQIQIVAQKQA